MAPVFASKASKSVNGGAQLRCGVPFAGTYPPPFCFQEPTLAASMRARGLASNWPAPTLKETMVSPWTWVAILIGLMVLMSTAAVCYQCRLSIAERRRARDEENMEREQAQSETGSLTSETGEEGTELRSMLAPHPLRRYRERRERRAASRQAHRDREERTIMEFGRLHQASREEQAPGVLVSETEVHSYEIGHENLLDEARWLSMRDTDLPRGPHQFEVHFREHTIARIPTHSSEEAVWRGVSGQSDLASSSSPSGIGIATPPPSYGSDSPPRPTM